jgi:hypothetical protein
VTEPILLPDLLAAMAAETRGLAAEARELEAALLSALLPCLAGQGDLATALQRLDPLLQRLTALSRIAAEAAAEAAPQPMPATTACLRAQRLAAFLPDLQAPPPPATAAVTLFDPPP